MNLADMYTTGPLTLHLPGGPCDGERVTITGQTGPQLTYEYTPAVNDQGPLMWTIDDAAALLHPPLTPAEIRAMIDLFGIRPTGTRRTGRRGRPLLVYDPAVLQEAHAVVMRARIDLGTFKAA